MENKTFTNFDELKKYYYDNFNYIRNLLLLYPPEKYIDEDDYNNNKFLIGLKKYCYDHVNEIKDLSLVYSSQRAIDEDKIFFDTWCFNEYKRIRVGLEKD
jgi:hypothetical protein